MSFQKLTYSGSECNNYVYFTFKGEFFDIDKITNELNIRPTKTRLKDDPVPKSTSWIHKINIGNEIDLTTPTKNLINLLEPKIDVIHKLK